MLHFEAIGGIVRRVVAGNNFHWSNANTYGLSIEIVLLDVIAPGFGRIVSRPSNNCFGFFSVKRAWDAGVEDL